MKLLASLAVAAGALTAQTNGSIDTPVLGVVFDRQTSALRLLEGIPGAARLGRVVETGFSEAAAGDAYAVVTEAGGMPSVISAAGRRRLPGARTGPVRAVVSPRGTSAALLFAEPVEIQVFTGLPESPQLRRSIDPGAPPADLAVSDDGELVLTLARAARGDDVVHVFRDSGALVFHRARRVAAMAFVPGSHDAVIADPSSARFVRADLGVEPIAADPDRDIVAVAASPGGARIVIASRSGRVTIHDSQTGLTRSLTCACSPAALTALRGDSLFRVDDRSGGPVWLLDLHPAEPRISFVARGEDQ